MLGEHDQLALATAGVAVLQDARRLVPPTVLAGGDYGVRLLQNLQDRDLLRQLGARAGNGGLVD